MRQGKLQARKLVLSPFIIVARNGKFGLIAGLLAGLALPGMAAILRPWIPEMVALLLFLTAFRIGFQETVHNLRAMVRTAATVLVLQMVLPLLFLSALCLADLPLSPLALAITLMLSAPSVTGSANFTILLGHDPAPALRLLILGTALLPVTCIPVFYFLPVFGELTDVLAAASRLLAVILFAAALGFASRQWTVPDLDEEGRNALDGLTVIALAVIVVGLMSAVRPALETEPATLAFWFSAAVCVNFGMQVLTFQSLRCLGATTPVPGSIVSGNRNFALFLVALPPERTEFLLIFLGCYQFPMYLTPIVMRRFYGRA